MTKEEEKLLLTDLCSRIPYAVRVKFTEFSSLNDKELIGITAYDNDMPIVTCRTENGIITMPLKYIKPYLYPLSSMTNEQKQYLKNRFYYDWNGEPYDLWKYQIEIGDADGLIDWFNKSHFDYRGLIPMGLAIDATNLKIY